MDTKSFVKILRKVIREEVGRAVKQALTEQTINHGQVIEHGMNLAEIAENPMPRRPIAKKKFSKNSMLNDILNETAATGDFASKPEMAAVQKALTRDYSGLIKAINKKNGKMGTK
mgnify:CR=1 FL=1